MEKVAPVMPVEKLLTTPACIRKSTLAAFVFISCSGLAAVARPQTAPAAPSQAPPTGPSSDDVQLLPLARQGMHQFLNGNPDGAIRIFQDMRRKDPKSPLGYLFEADATWWKIYLTIGNLVDPDVFDVVSKTSSPYDEPFQSLARETIRLADARVRAQQGVARNLLYEGMAYGLLGRFYGLRDNDLPTARAGKKMRNLLLKTLQLDPNLTDAYLGIGTYNYFVAALPGIVKMLKFLIGLPGGNRQAGLEQLELAARKGDLVRGEAEFYLAKDFSRGDERQYDKSLFWFQELAREYPGNALWKLMEGSLQMRLGHRQAGEALYREAVQMTAALNTDVGRALHDQAQRALGRLGTPAPHASP